MLSNQATIFKSTVDFVEKWFCCGAIDDHEVVAEIRTTRSNPDYLAEELIMYTHSPRQRHETSGSTDVYLLDNNFDNPRTTPTGVNPLTMEVDLVTHPALAQPVSVPAAAPTAEVLATVFACSALYEKWGKIPVAQGVTEGKPALPVAPKKPKTKNAKKGDNSKSGNGEGAGPDPVPVEETGEPVGKGPSSVFRVCQDVIEVKQHRRIRTKHRGKYVAVVVSEIKNRLGCPMPTEANLLAVRRMAKNIMDKHGLRPTHVRVAIESVIAGVFVPDEYDERSAKVLGSNTIRALRDNLYDSAPKSVYRKAWDAIWHPFMHRRRERMEPGGDKPPPTERSGGV